MARAERRPVTGNSLVPPKPAPPLVRRLSYQVGNMQQVGTRPRQEDSFAFANALDVHDMKNKGLLALVADGMGGMQNGKQVSEAAAQAMLAEFSAMDREGDLAAQLRAAVERTTALLYGRFGGTGGTTLVACVIFREQLYFACVGDSYLYLKRNGGLFRLNREQNYRHQLYLEEIRAGNMDPTAANEDPEGSRLSQFVGMDELEDVDVLRRPLPLQNGDVLLLCSDGVGGVLTPRQLLDCLREPEAADACLRIENEVQRQGRVHQDNYTALVVRCTY